MQPRVLSFGNHKTSLGIKSQYGYDGFWMKKAFLIPKAMTSEEDDDDKDDVDDDDDDYGRCGLYSNYFSMHHMCLECSTVIVFKLFFLFLLKSYIKDFFDPDKIEFHQLHDIIGNKIFLIFVKRGLCSNYFFFNPIEI